MDELNQMAFLVHYAGRVQGVGFRATVVYLARDYPIAGWVRNLPDGRVQLLAEGEPETVAQFLDAVRRRWQAYITDEQVEPRPASGKQQGFSIAR